MRSQTVKHDWEVKHGSFKLQNNSKMIKIQMIIKIKEKF